MEILFVLLAGLCGATVNYCFRKNFEKHSSAKGYLSVCFFFSFAISFFFNPALSLHSFHFAMSFTGMFAGILSLLVATLTATALRRGPSGITFAFQNAACILPTFILFILFGPPYGFELTAPSLIGFSLLVVGLFLSAFKSGRDSLNTREANSFTKWVIATILVFFIQGFILALFQWRSLLLDPQIKRHLLIPWSCTAEEDAWFMPGFFLVPLLFQALSFILTEQRWISKGELLLGSIAGALNGVSTFYLLLATKVASPETRPLLFPLFAVTVILLSSLWSKYFYEEPIHWTGLILCIAGVLVAGLKF
jgi:hypothetical protein